MARYDSLKTKNEKIIQAISERSQIVGAIELLESDLEKNGWLTEDQEETLAQLREDLAAYPEFTEADLQYAYAAEQH